MGNKIKILKLKMLIFLAFVIMAVFILIGFYSKLIVSEYVVASRNLPESFDGFRIVLISDMHGYIFGEKQSELIEAIEEQNPDMIVLCGDMIDKKDKTVIGGSFTNLAYLLNGIKEIAPVYAVSGNHEMLASSEAFMKLLDVYESYDVIYMHGETVEITKDDQSVQIYSIPPKLNGSEKGHWADFNHDWKNTGEDYSILLCHFGNEFDFLSEGGHDLVLSGHTHGGIIRIFGRGLLGNDKKLFPNYDKGLFAKNGSTMIISAGLGDAFIPRFFNRRELVTIILRKQSDE